LRACNLLRESLHYRRDAFDAGLRRAGYRLESHISDPGPGDLLLIWNRYSRWAAEAERFERAGAAVMVAENGYLGKSWRGGEWFALAYGQHAGAGQWYDGGPERWDAWGVELSPWRTGPGETLILGQRGIGPPGVASPARWELDALKRCGGRIRLHPGKTGAGPSLDDDLAGAAEVVTWHSSAALLALMRGVPAWYAFPLWIGAPAARPVSEHGGRPSFRCDAARLGMFRRLAWAMWEIDEVREGTPFARQAANSVYGKTSPTKLAKFCAEM
jgi:hypothetical protein